MSGSEPQPGQPYAGMPPIVINNVATSAAHVSRWNRERGL